jgi:sugar lactone lactonase YvrE
VTDARAATREELEKFPDARGKGHQVVKFSPEGKVLLTLGRAGVAGDPPDYLNMPCDVITATNGDIFVADGQSGRSSRAPGHTASRIVKFSKGGNFIKAWGTLGSGPGEFRTPHALAFDSRGRLFVADRGNMRIQIFDQEGNFLQEWKQFSRVSGLHIDGDDVLYAVDSESDATNHPGWGRGIRIGSARDGTVRFFIPGHQTDLPEGTAGEGVTVDADGHVYAAEKVVRGVTKYVKRSAAR